MIADSLLKYPSTKLNIYHVYVVDHSIQNLDDIRYVFEKHVTVGRCAKFSVKLNVHDIGRFKFEIILMSEFHENKLERRNFRNR